MGPVKAVIFDCDGTLVNSEHTYFLAFQKVFRKRGWELTLEEYNACIGNPCGVDHEFISQRIEGGNVEEILCEAIRYYRDLQVMGIAPIEPTVDFLHALAREKERLDLKLGLASAAGKYDILANLKVLGVEHFFDVILSGEDDLADYNDPEGVNKPKPYIYLHAAKELNLEPAECVAIEDSYSGVTAAVKAGCFTIAVPNHQTQKHDLSHAHLKIETFANVSVEEFLQLVAQKRLG